MKKLLFIILFSIGCNTSSVKEINNASPNFWEIKYFVNQQKEFTDVGYITNKNPIIGTYTNSQDKTNPLKAKIMIKDKAIGIKLYENGRESAIKGSKQEPIEYEIKVHHNNKNIDTIFRGINETDVIVVGNIISSTQQTILINYLKLGGKFQFHLKSSNNKAYRFTIHDQSNLGFSNMLNSLNKGK